MRDNCGKLEKLVRDLRVEGRRLDLHAVPFRRPLVQRLPSDSKNSFIRREIYCAVGCSLIAYTRKQADGTVKLLQIEGDPDSPVNEGRLCPKGATAMQLATSDRRVESPLYRAPGATAWQKMSWDDMLDKLARRIKDSRDRTFVAVDKKGNVVNRTEGIAFAGGAAFSNEEGYLAAKVMRGLGLVYLEQQARV